MKQFKILGTLLAFTGLLHFISSCNSGDEKKAADSTIVKTNIDTTLKSEPSIKPGNIMFIKHKVADFTKWLAGYDSHDSVRKAYGLHNFGVSRGIDDSNMVLVALKMDDLNKAKEFAALPSLKAAMEKSGVVGAPTIMYYDRQTLDLSSNAINTRVLVSHKVKDWDAWKKEFDSHRQARIDAGIMDRSVGYEVGNNKMVNIVATVSDLKKAKDFFSSKDLKDKMAAAGVDGPPTIFFYNLVKKY